MAEENNEPKKELSDEEVDQLLKKVDAELAAARIKNREQLQNPKNPVLSFGVLLMGMIVFLLVMAIAGMMYLDNLRKETPAQSPFVPATSTNSTAPETKPETD